MNPVLLAFCCDCPYGFIQGRSWVPPKKRGTTLKCLCLEVLPAIRVPGEVLWHFHPFQAKIDESLGNDFDSFTKSLEDSRKVFTFAGRTVKRNDNNEAKS